MMQVPPTSALNHPSNKGKLALVGCRWVLKDTKATTLQKILLTARQHFVIEQVVASEIPGQVVASLPTTNVWQFRARSEIPGST